MITDEIAVDLMNLISAVNRKIACISDRVLDECEEWLNDVTEEGIKDKELARILLVKKQLFKDMIAHIRAIKPKSIEILEKGNKVEEALANHLFFGDSNVQN